MSSRASDLTARARIRDAAIALFAERGVDAATIRDIAQAAGVSSGLLRHHFGSKEGLRDACDEWALAELTTMNARLMEMQLLDSLDPQIMLLQRYLIRSTLDGSPAGAALFDRMIEFGEHWLKTADLKVSDPRAFVAVLGVMKMSMFAMSDLLSRALDDDVTKPRGWTRMILASLEIFSTPLLTPELAEVARESLARFTTPEEEPCPRPSMPRD